MARQGIERPRLSKIEDVYDRFEKRQDASLDARQTRQMHRAPSRRRANGMRGFEADCDGGGVGLAGFARSSMRSTLQRPLYTFSSVTR